MRSSLNILPILLFALVSLPQVAHAHLIGGSGLASGLNHPLFGLDHLLTMIAAGIIVTQIGGKAVWKVPATFVSFMVMGGLLAITGFAMPIAETGIALSVLAFGVFIALYTKYFSTAHWHVLRSLQYFTAMSMTMKHHQSRTTLFMWRA